MAYGFQQYIITPRDLVSWAESLRPRDYLGGLVSAAIGVVFGLWLQDWSAGLFAVGMTGAIWWRVDARWPLGAAIVCLIMIPLFQYSYNANLLISGADIASGLAVVVWYLMAIGVTRQVLQLRTSSGPSEARPLAPEAATVSIPPARAAAPAKTPRASRPANPALVPSWKRRLADLERDAARPSRSHDVDSVKPKRP